MTIQKGLKASQREEACGRGLRANWRGLRSNLRGLRASWRCLMTSQRGMSLMVAPVGNEVL